MSTACGYSEAVYSTTIKLQHKKSFLPLIKPFLVDDGAFFLSTYLLTISTKSL